MPHVNPHANPPGLKEWEALRTWLSGRHVHFHTRAVNYRRDADARSRSIAAKMAIESVLRAMVQIEQGARPAEED